jgi:hypothetical protein
VSGSLSNTVEQSGRTVPRVEIVSGRGSSEEEAGVAIGRVGPVVGEDWWVESSGLLRQSSSSKRTRLEGSVTRVGLRDRSRSSVFSAIGNCIVGVAGGVLGSMFGVPGVDCCLNGDCSIGTSGGKEPIDVSVVIGTSYCIVESSSVGTGIDMGDERFLIGGVVGGVFMLYRSGDGNCGGIGGMICTGGGAGGAGGCGGGDGGSEFMVVSGFVVDIDCGGSSLTPGLPCGGGGGVGGGNNGMRGGSELIELGFIVSSSRSIHEPPYEFHGEGLHGLPAITEMSPIEESSSPDSVDGVVPRVSLLFVSSSVPENR